MSKREVDVKLNTRTDRHGNDIQELKIGKKLIGEIKADNGKLKAVSSRDTVYSAKDIDEAIQLLLSEYNLHK